MTTTMLSVEDAAVRHLREGDVVEAGLAGTEDYDVGTIVRLDGAIAWVAWDSGVRTPIPVAELRRR
jgi:hypothetical protein